MSNGLNPPSQSEPSITKASRIEESNAGWLHKVFPVSADRAVTVLLSAQTRWPSDATRRRDEGTDHATSPVFRPMQTMSRPFW